MSGGVQCNDVNITVEELGCTPVAATAGNYCCYYTTANPTNGSPHCTDFYYQFPIGGFSGEVGELCYVYGPNEDPYVGTVVNKCNDCVPYGMIS